MAECEDEWGESQQMADKAFRCERWKVVKEWLGAEPSRTSSFLTTDHPDVMKSCLSLSYVWDVYNCPYFPSLVPCSEARMTYCVVDHIFFDMFHAVRHVQDMISESISHLTCQIFTVSCNIWLSFIPQLQKDPHTHFLNATRTALSLSPGVRYMTSDMRSQATKPFYYSYSYLNCEALLNNAILLLLPNYSVFIYYYAFTFSF